MPRGRVFAIVVLPLLAALLMAQAPALPPNKPRPATPALKKPAPAAPQRKPAAPTVRLKKIEVTQPEPKPHDFSDYFRVWGVSGDTTRAEIVARFGKPQRTGDSERKPLYYFNDNLVFFFTADDTVGTMIVGNSFEATPPNAIPPDVKQKAFIGRKRDDVLKAFGPAQVVSSDNYRYLPKSGVYKVEFQCYDFKGYVCEQLLVQF
jgi:hypothetical protein